VNLKRNVRYFVPNKRVVPSAPFPPVNYHSERAPGTTTYLAYPLPDEDEKKGKKD